MNDLEMTKLCAAAMGMNVDHVAEMFGRIGGDRYDPLHYDAQAMALVKKFGLTIDPQEDKPPFTWRVVVAKDGDWDKQIYSHGSDLNRAIVECAAKIQSAEL